MITAIAAVMLHSSNPEALAHWYTEHLGIPLELEEGAWHGEISDAHARTFFIVVPYGGPTVPVRPAITVTFRVDNLDTMLAHLRAHHIPIDRLEQSEYGRVAYFRDLDGNPIELWSEAIPVRRRGDVMAEGI